MVNAVDGVAGKRTYRSFRPIFVPSHREVLSAELDGVIELPIMLDWTPDSTYDLSNPFSEMRFYEVVLRESFSDALMGSYLNWDRLVQLWPDLWLSREIRAAWEEKFPELSQR